MLVGGGYRVEGNEGENGTSIIAYSMKYIKDKIWDNVYKKIKFFFSMIKRKGVGFRAQ